MKRLMLLLMAALLASCGSPAVFERPVMEMPEGTARTSPVGTGWWRIFNDRALDRLEERPWLITAILSARPPWWTRPPP